MEYVIRKAQSDDLGQIIVQLKRLESFVDMKHSLYSGNEDAELIIGQLIKNNYFLVAINESQDIIGLIAGLLSPHFLNKKIMTFIQLFWWVREDMRGTKIGGGLLDLCVKYGKENADYLVFGLGPESTVDKNVLLSRGFKPGESHYVMEI